MKKCRIGLLLLMVLLCLGACANAGERDPELPATIGFDWDVIDGNAWLRGIGDVKEENIVIPATVKLSETEGLWEEDPESGEAYPVIVAGDAFKNCEILRTVTFHNGVQIENNEMHKKLGMFLKCVNLEGVYNIPDSVTSMRGTFTNCTSLREISNFPAALTDLTGCFTSCASMTSVPEIPDSVVSMTDCFQMCIALQAIPNFPAALVDLYGCFRGCAALTVVPVIPDGVTSMVGCFRGCSSLLEIPEIPVDIENLTDCFRECTSLTEIVGAFDAVRNMTNCFLGCTALEFVEISSSSVENMTGCFQDCISLRQAVVRSDSVTDMTSCFQACTSLMVVDVLPSSVVVMDYTFMDCASLVQVVDIPEDVERMQGCFMNCTSLEYAPKLPYGLVRLVEGFMGCTSLKEIPELPESLTNASWCFAGCDSLTGDVYLPNWIIERDAGQFMFNSCKNLGSVYVDWCPLSGVFQVIAETSEPIRMVATRDHIPGEVCPMCRTDTEFVRFGDLIVVLEGGTEGQKEWFVRFLREEVPSCFIEDCEYITLSDDVEKFYWDDATIVNGYAGENSASIMCSWDTAQLAYTIFHELGHCYDFDAGAFGLSYSEEWRSLHEKEGETASQWYAQGMYLEYNEWQQRCETFAIAVGKYFTDPNALQSRCPGMYEYLEELFGDVVISESEG